MLRSIICASALVLSGLLHAQTITAVGDPWPPFLDPEQPKQGLVVEIATAAFASQGHDPALRELWWLFGDRQRHCGGHAPRLYPLAPAG